MKYIIFGARGGWVSDGGCGFFNVALVGITSPMVQPGPGELPGWYLWTDDLPQWAYCFAGACGVRDWDCLWRLEVVSHPGCGGWHRVRFASSSCSSGVLFGCTR
jgi:hypothetical protein